MSKLKWLYQRFSTMSAPEVFFRAKQAVQKYKERLLPATPRYTSFSSVTFSIHPDLALVNSGADISAYSFFGLDIDINGPIDFHTDISSGKTFPMIFSKDIDTRSGKFGDAKVVWEINRLQFLLPIILKYKQTGDVRHLDHFVAIMQEWHKQNPYLKGVNWYSNIEVNIRLINWYWCWVMLDDDKKWKQDGKYASFRDNIWVPLIYQHCFYSNNNPSYFSSANNHLISEYAGLFVATTIWKFPETTKWQEHAIAGLEKEIIIQHSVNGVNREEAAEYIQFITDFFLIPYVVGQHHGLSFSAGYRDMLTKICRYIYNFIDVKGNYPKYGDDDDGKVIVPTGNTHDNNFLCILNSAVVLLDLPGLKLPGAVWDLKSALLTAHANGHKKWSALPERTREDASVYYTEEGHFYFRKIKGGGEIYLHFNAAPLGFLALAAHGHSDALSVTLNVDGYPILVDPGTYTYYKDKENRRYFTGVNSHNTISFDKKDQANHAGAMLWLDHYKTRLLLAEKNGATERVKASHNGYANIGCDHQRLVEFNRSEDSFDITDNLSVSENASIIIMHWHLHPDVKFTRNDNNELIIEHPNLSRKIYLTLPQEMDEISVEDGWYSDGFLQKEQCKVINCYLRVKDRQQINLKSIIHIR